MWQAQGMAYGKGETPKMERFLHAYPSGHMVKNHMTVIRVDGELPKNVDLTLESYGLWKGWHLPQPFFVS